MNKNERVAEHLNRALHTLFAEDPRVLLLGEDLLDPYGGAFKISSGLSTRYPERVLPTPLSEETFLGIGSGLALCGEKVIVEIMFGDFLALGYDHILNFASKAIAMYGRPLALHLVIRCPVGGNRGYGPTHSQCMQKYFLGIPHVRLFELSPFHDAHHLLTTLVNLGQPCLLFEDKVLYTQRMYTGGVIDEYFVFQTLDQEQNMVRVCLADEEASCPDGILIAPGGMVARCLQAMKQVFLQHEIALQLYVPAQIYPFEVHPLLPFVQGVEHLFVVEESVAGGTWGCEVAQQLYHSLWGQLRSPVQLIHSKASVIPAAPHLEKRVLVQAEDIAAAVVEALHATD